MAKITIEMLTVQLATILKKNAPVRGENIPAGRRMPKNYLRPTKTSPHPGNLKLNAIRDFVSGDKSQVVVGGPQAVYAEVTEHRSFKKGWLAKSKKEFLELLRRYGGKIR